MHLLEYPLFKYIVAILAPSLLALAVYPVWRKSRLAPFIYYIFSWVLGFIIVQYLGSIIAHRMRIENRGKILSEEDFAAIPDGPNITASWILLGWLAPLFAMLMIKAIRSKTNDRTTQ